MLPRMFHEVFVLANVDEVPVPGPDGVVGPPLGSQQPKVSHAWDSDEVALMLTPVILFQYTILSDTFRFIG